MQEKLRTTFQVGSLEKNFLNRIWWLWKQFKGSGKTVQWLKPSLHSLDCLSPRNEYTNRHIERQPCFRQGYPEYVIKAIIKNDQSIHGLMKSMILSIRNKTWQSSLKSPQHLQSSAKGKADHSESLPRQKSRNEDNEQQQVLASLDTEGSVFAGCGGVN